MSPQAGRPSGPIIGASPTHASVDTCAPAAHTSLVENVAHSLAINTDNDSVLLGCPAEPTLQSPLAIQAKLEVDAAENAEFDDEPDPIFVEEPLPQNIQEMFRELFPLLRSKHAKETEDILFKACDIALAFKNERIACHTALECHFFTHRALIERMLSDV